MAAEEFDSATMEPRTHERDYPSTLVDAVEKLMLRFAIVIGFILGPSIASMGSAQDKPDRPKTVTRAKRPVFTERDWSGIYFQDLFAEGLDGARPQNFGQRQKPTVPAAIEVVSENGESATSGWAEWISSSALEDEIKNAHLELESLVNTVQSFNSDAAKVRESLSRLATWFAIVAEFNDTVRWKADAVAARDGLAQAAANARTTSSDAFASVQAQKEQLAELIRGGKFAAGSAASEMNWTHWVDRVALMSRLEIAVTERLKPWTSNEAEFAAHQEEILHEANVAAAIGQALVQSGVIDADDDEYAGFAKSMSQAAKELQAALETNQFAEASSAANRMGKACADCHEAYR